jgi:hypothetical protein
VYPGLPLLPGRHDLSAGERKIAGHHLATGGIETLPATGYDDISLLSLSTGDYGCIAPLMDRLMNRCEAGADCGVAAVTESGHPSLPELMEQIRKVRKTGFTIAPEAGTQRLRDVINKNVSRKDIFETAQQAFSLGWRVIKLYFMIGLPTETDADIDGIVCAGEGAAPAL